jgi:similar to stage IV sporulation protein
VIHDNNEIRTLLKKELTNYGIDTFRLIPNFNKRRIILEKIKENNKETIEWLEIERKGSLLIVKVTERKTNPKNEELKVRDIVAKKQGIIKKIIATEGVILKKVNDYVSKGETIITGNIIKDETIKGQVISKGLVYAETWYKVKVEYPLYYEEIKYLNEYKNNLIINVFDKKYSLRKNYTDSYLEKKYTLIKSKIIPLEISIQKQRKTKVTKEFLTDEEAIKKAANKATSKIELTLDKDEYIIDKKTLYFDKENSKIIVEIFFRVYENITDYKNIDILKPGDKVIIE